MHTLVKALVNNTNLSADLAAMAGQYGSYKAIRTYLNGKGVNCKQLDTIHNPWLAELVDYYKQSEVDESTLAAMLSSIK